MLHDVRGRSGIASEENIQDMGIGQVGREPALGPVPTVSLSYLYACCIGDCKIMDFFILLGFAPDES
jgi:hypothetical protein